MPNTPDNLGGLCASCYNKRITTRENERRLRQEKKEQILDAIRAGDRLKDVAQRLNVGLQNAYHICRRAGVPVKAWRRDPSSLMRALDDIRSGKKASQVSTETAIPVSRVRYAARQAGIRLIQGPSGRTLPEIWKSLDWRRRDAHLARELGVSRERVGQVRRRLNKPKVSASSN